MEVFSGAIVIAEEWIVDPKANVEVVFDTRSALSGRRELFYSLNEAVGKARKYLGDVKRKAQSPGL